MNPFPRLLPVACSAGLLLADAPAQTVTWRGDPIPIEQLEADAEGVAAAPTVAAWSPFVDSARYRMVLSDDHQVLLVLNERYQRKSPRTEHPEVKKLLATLDRTIAAVDELLGGPDAARPPAVVVAAPEADYPALLSHVARLDPRLADWAHGRAEAVAGFVLSEPLVAAWLDDGRGQEEWDPHNELVHRATQLLVRRRAAQLPPWFPLGLAWHVEEQVRGSVYCFPYRAGFVWAAEHGDWDKRLAAAFKPDQRKRDGLPTTLTIDEFADWDPKHDGGEFDTLRAYVAFGVVRFLAHHHPDSILRVAKAFDEAIRSGWRTEISETEWVTDPNYRLPAARQLEILRAIDLEILTSVTEAFVKKRLAKPRRATRAG